MKTVGREKCEIVAKFGFGEGKVTDVSAKEESTVLVAGKKMASSFTSKLHLVEKNMAFRKEGGGGEKVTTFLSSSVKEQKKREKPILARAQNQKDEKKKNEKTSKAASPRGVRREETFMKMGSHIEGCG